MIDEILRSKYSKIKFYCHNLGGYDVVFILKILMDYNDNHDDKYLCNTMMRDSTIIKIVISKNGQSVDIGDSYCILTSSLAKLGRDFETNTNKGIFPYKEGFATQDNLFYVGDTPSMSFYNDISIEDYKLHSSSSWDFKQTTISYLNDDLQCLYEVLTKANKQIHKDFKVSMMEGNTISSLAMKIYLNSFYNENIPHISKHSMYTDIKESYYGGITEGGLYIPFGENLLYYDVNSLYPFARVGRVLNDMPGSKCSKVNFFNNGSSINDLFGFFYCQVESPVDSYLGLLPVKHKGGIMMANGKWEGWYFSEEI